MAAGDYYVNGLKVTADGALYVNASVSGLDDATDVTKGDALVAVKRQVVGSVATTVHDWIEGQVLNVKTDFGAVGDGVTDDSGSILAASVAAASQGKSVDFGGGTYLVGSQIALTSAHNGVKWLLRGATIKKGFSGDLASLTGCDDFALDGTGVIDGQHGTYTGKGFVLSSGSNNPVFGAGIKFTSFTDTHIEFGADSGKAAKVLSNFRPGTGQTDARYIHCTGPDTQSMNRTFVGNVMPSGYMDLDAAFDTMISAASFKRVEIDSNCQVTIVADCVWGNSGTAMTASGGTTIIVGGRFSGSLTLDANFSGVFGPAKFTSGSLINNSINATIIGDAQPIGTLKTTTVAAAVPADTSEDVLATVSIGAGKLYKNDGLKVTTYWSWTNSVNNKTLRVRFGASGAGTGGSLAGSYTATTSTSGVMETLIHNSNNTGSQRLVSKITTDTTAVLTNLTSSAIDCTAATEIAITGQKASAGETMTLQGYRVEIVRT